MVGVQVCLSLYSTCGFVIYRVLVKGSPAVVRTPHWVECSIACSVPNLLHKCTWVLSSICYRVCMWVTVCGRHLPEVGVLSYKYCQYIHCNHMCIAGMSGVIKVPFFKILPYVYIMHIATMHTHTYMYTHTHMLFTHTHIYMFMLHSYRLWVILTTGPYWNSFTYCAVSSTEFDIGVLYRLCAHTTTAGSFTIYQRWQCFCIPSFKFRFNITVF